jgi:hydroxypyruvate isomerase
MAKIKQSLVFWCLNATEWKWDIHRIAEAACRLGCGSVELTPPEFWPVLRSYGLTCAIAPNGMAEPAFAKGLNNPRYQEQVIETTRRTIDQCADAGIPTTIAFAGYKWRDADDPTSGEIPRAEAAANMVRGLRALAEFGEARGVTVCLEQLNTRDNTHPDKGHPGYQGDDMDWCAEIVREVASPRVKLLFDVYHVAIMQGDVIRRLRQYGPLIGHVHTAGVPGRNEIGSAQEIQYPAVMRVLKETGYDGYVGQEFIPTREPMEGLAEAVALCDV